MTSSSGLRLGAVQVSLGFILLYLLMVVFEPFGRQGQETLATPLAAIAGAWAVLWSFTARRRARGRSRSAWTWITVGCGLWTFGTVAAIGYEVLNGRGAQSPSLADGFYLMALPATLAGTLLLTAPHRFMAQTRVLLDAVLFSLALTIPIWRDVLLPIIQADDLSLAAQAFHTLYLFNDVLLLFGVCVALIYPMVRQRSVLVFFIAGLLSLVISDVLFAFLSSIDAYTPGSVVDMLRVSACMLLACAASCQGEEPAVSEREVASPQPWHAVVPVAALVPMVLWFIYTSITSGLDDVLTPVLLGVYGLLFGIRQLTAHLELTSLTRTLASAHRELRGLYSHLEDAYQLEMIRARRDGLTGAFNRHGILEYLDDLITGQQPFSICMADLDGLKEVNDVQGHLTGDWMLRKFAEVCEGRPSAIVGRYGGDEFLIVMRLADGDECEREVAFICDQYEEETEATLGWSASSVSVGVATFPSEGVTAAALIALADERMYEQKRDTERHSMGMALQAQIPGNEETSSATASQSLDEEDSEHRRITNAIRVEDLAQALDGDAIEVHFQPFVEFGTLRPKGAEALVRWRHPVLGLVEARDFVPLAERSSLITRIGTQVLEKSCQTMAEWVRLSPEALRNAFVAVNVSGRQVRRQFVDEVRGALDRSGLEPRHLVLEITESMVMKRHEAACEILEAVHDMGVRLALDDFGRSYASISYLRYFPFDFLKLDSSFVRGIIANGKESYMAPGILSLAHGLGLQVIVEGIETESDMDVLRAMPIDYAQGYLFGRPAPAAEIQRRLDDKDGHAIGRGDVAA